MQHALCSAPATLCSEPWGTGRLPKQARNSRTRQCSLIPPQAPHTLQSLGKHPWFGHFGHHSNVKKDDTHKSALLAEGEFAQFSQTQHRSQDLQQTLS